MSKTDATTEVAADAHAERRLNDLPVELYEAPAYGRHRAKAMASLTLDGVTVCMWADGSTTEGRLHEAAAAVYLQVALSLGLRQEGPR